MWDPEVRTAVLAAARSLARIDERTRKRRVVLVPGRGP
jgi:hypothetical protein